MTGLSRLEAKVTWQLSRANARAHRKVQEAFGLFGMRGYQYRVLAALEQLGPSSQADLGRLTVMDRSDVNAALTDLVRDGLAVKVPDQCDRRRNLVSITSRGVHTLDQLDVALGEVQQAVLGPLTERERATLLRLLSKLGE